MRNISNSSFGCYVKVNEENKFVAPDNEEGIGLVRKIVEEKPEVLVLRVEISNQAKKEIRVNSIVVAEFLLPVRTEMVLENGWGQSSFSGYRNKIVKTRPKKFFLRRDQNPNSFLESYGYPVGSMVNEWFTQLIFPKGRIVIGAVTSRDQFSQIYLNQNRQGVRVRVTCQLDGLTLKPGEKILSEMIAFVWEQRTRQSLEIYSDLIKKHSKTKSIKNPPVGLCCAYYYQGNVVSEDYLLDQLKALSIFPKKSNIKYVEIDAGYCVWGDWLEINESFPLGMKSVVKEVRKAGLKAGLWFAPYVASSKSRVYLEHPEWFLRDDSGRELSGRQSSPLDFLPQLLLKVLDPTHPEVRSYIKKVVKQMLDWGFEMLKIDFTYPVCFSGNYFLPVTRAQALRMGYETIRNAAGKKTHLMSAITQLSPLVGIVDSARVGIDTINPYVSKFPVVGKMINNYMFRESMRNSSARLFLNGKVWINDADCFVGRRGSGLTGTQVGEQFDFIKKFRGSVWIGDSLKTMTKDNLDKYIDLFKKKRK